MDAGAWVSLLVGLLAIVAGFVGIYLSAVLPRWIEGRRRRLGVIPGLAQHFEFAEWLKSIETAEKRVQTAKAIVDRAASLPNGLSIRSAAQMIAKELSLVDEARKAAAAAMANLNSALTQCPSDALNQLVVGRRQAVDALVTEANDVQQRGDEIIGLLHAFAKLSEARRVVVALDESDAKVDARWMSEQARAGKLLSDVVLLVGPKQESRLEQVVVGELSEVLSLRDAAVKKRGLRVDFGASTDDDSSLEEAQEWAQPQTPPSPRHQT